MNLALMSSKLTPKFSVRVLLLAVVGWLSGQSLQAGSILLQGQNKGDTNTRYGGNLQNWLELDYIPCRVYFSAAQGNNQTITLTFEHQNNGNPEIENLFTFTSSSNIVFTAGPTLSAPPSGSTWTYTFTVNVLDSQNAYVWFFARLAAGAHLNTGSSLTLGGTPSSMGNLQIHKPAPAKGSPDLLVVKTGPATTSPGDIISYTLSYTNKPTAPNLAPGVQLSDTLPATVTLVPTNLPSGGLLVGNTIYWDLPNLEPGSSGQITFQVHVNASTPYNYTFTNFAQILSAENDLNYADNTSTVITTTVGCAVPSILVRPLSATACLGDSITFAGIANGTGPLTYQWSKNGTAIAGATNSSYAIASIASQDAGSYVVAVTNACGNATSTPATLTVSINVSATPLLNLTQCPGDTATFSTTASGTSPFSYVWFKDGVVLSNQNSGTLTISGVTASDAGNYSVVVSGACGSTVTNSASLTVATGTSASPLASLVKCSGESAAFSTLASGTGPFSYQWSKDGTALAETNSVLTIASVGAADAGLYTVVVSGACGSPVTNSASLTLNQNVV